MKFVVYTFLAGRYTERWQQQKQIEVWRLREHYATHLLYLLQVHIAVPVLLCFDTFVYVNFTTLLWL